MGISTKNVRTQFWDVCQLMWKWVDTVQMLHVVDMLQMLQMLQMPQMLRLQMTLQIRLIQVKPHVHKQFWDLLAMRVLERQHTTLIVKDAMGLMVMDRLGQIFKAG